MAKTEAELEVQLKKAETAFFKADEYHDLRPKYTVESAKYLLKQVGVLSDDNELITKNCTTPVTIVELGSGTGLLTIAVVAALKGKMGAVRYIATDPLESMQETFLKQLPGVEFVTCTAEDLPFPDGSVRAILAGASYHWFANKKAYEEMYRVLEPAGMLGYISNLPSETAEDRAEWTKEMYDILWKSYRKTGAPFQHDYKWKNVLMASGLFDKYKEDFHLKNLQQISIEECIQCISSFGGVASGGDEHRQKFEKDLGDILQRHYTGKSVEFPGIEHTIEIQTCQSKKTK